MKKRWLPILFIISCFVTGSVIPVYAAENKSSELESLTSYTVVSEHTAKNFSRSLIHSLAQGEAIQLVKSDILNKEKIEKEKVVKAEAAKKAQAEKVAKEKEAAEKKQAELDKQKAANAKPSGQKMMMEATAYSCNEGFIGGGNLTAMGQDLRVDPMAIAVDPSVIPLGTKLYVEGYGEAIASDTGGAIKGNIIDLHFSDVSQCIEWGRRQVEVTILA
ncbi:3D domain-containing protein [Candidatus Enterococcus ikei]|uniref:3D domain-containing protein n=1 Tax=Candidatus Enterococcus ikei TaxID=2815326 RepID=A0ABS3GW84_9ENTE|nr:3D domain-containing protein [Enterococcus sp. DIV0869a]MBO0439527.1 3D domain-containing protein [Enterococcus sp. DIV0869a]